MTTTRRMRLLPFVPAKHEKGSIFLALLLMIAGLALLLGIASVVDAGQRKSRAANDFTLASQATDTAINSALFTLNSTSPAPNISSGASGTLPTGASWKYTAAQTAGTPAGMSWTVTAVGTYRTTPITKTAVINGTGISQSAPTWPTALFGGQGVYLDSAACASSPYCRVGSYSTVGGPADTAGTGFGVVGSNGNINFTAGHIATGTTVDAVSLYGWAADPNPGRCSSATSSSSMLCSGLINYYSFAEVSNIPAALTSAQSNCSGTPGPVTISKATALSGGSYTCATTLAVNAAVTSNGTTSSPATIVTNGNATVSSSIGSTSSFPDPTNLVMYVNGSLTAANTTIAGVVAASGNCTFSGNVTIYGALSCAGTVSTTGTLNVYAYTPFFAAQVPTTTQVWMIVNEGN